MKTWQKKCKLIAILALCVVHAIIAGSALFNNLYEPKRCALDGYGMKYHAPVILDLATGELAEMEVYDPHPYLVGENAEEQTTDHMGLSMTAGIMMYSSAGVNCRAILPEKRGRMKKSLYCRECRKLLSDVTTKGYVLLDMYDPDNIKAYKIAEGAEYANRDYSVAVYTDENTGHLNILTTGMLNQ